MGVMDALPDDKRTKCRFLQKEGMQLDMQLLTSAKHVQDLFVKTVTFAVSLCRHAWLCTTHLQPDTRTLIEELPL